MSNIKILFRNIIDFSSTTLVEENNLTGMGQSNLAHVGRHYIFRSDGELSPLFKFNLGGATASITDVFVFDTNVETDATIQTILYDADSQGGSTLYDSTALTVLTSGNTAFMEDNKHIHKSFSAVNAVMSGRVVLSDSGNPDSYIQASRLFVGNCWAPTVGFSQESSFGWNDTSEQYRTQGGSLRSTPGVRYREISLEFGLLTEQEMLDLNDNCRYVGLEKDFAIAGYNTFTGQIERDFIVRVKLKSKPSIVPIGHNYYSANLELLEV